MFLFQLSWTLKKIALATGHEADVAVIDQKLDAIRRSFDGQYWKGSYYMSAQVTTPDDRANAMAVNVGLADRAKWDAIYANVLTKKTYASCFFDRWVFEALCQSATRIAPAANAPTLPDDDPLQLHNALGTLRPLVGLPHRYVRRCLVA